MPTPTYVAIAKTVLTGNATSAVFSAISGTYTDLLVVVSARTDYADFVDEMTIQLNAVATGNYSQTDVYAYSTTVYSARRTTANNQLIRYQVVAGANATSNTFGNTEIYFPNYTGSTQKVVSITYTPENNSATNFQLGASAALTNLTSAITSITLKPFYGTNFVSGSRFDLYGIKNS